MKEIAPSIHIETGFQGVTLGAINWPHGLLLIDAPSQTEDIRSWRAALLNLGGGIDRLLIYLDAHPDRTLGGRGMDCTVVASEQTAEAFRNRPVNFKGYLSGTGADWENHPRLGNVRWSPPEITFTEQMLVYWDDSPMILESHPGPAQGAIWAIFPEQKVIFVGDTIVADQPPFLEDADIPRWLGQLDLLGSKRYQDFLLVSGRQGLVRQEHISSLKQFLRKVERGLEKLVRKEAPAEKTESLIESLMSDFDVPKKSELLYQQRLQYGLYHYYSARFFPPSSGNPGEES
jgi:glyoxylase-like metal-dependent hydrolase (beta-lactamase superfamily II)